jgi:hypothetical protein
MVVVVGITMYNAILMSFQNLNSATDSYYEEYRLPHLFVRLNNAPESVVGIAGRTDGVIAAQGRLVLDVPMEIPGYEGRVQARIVSVPPSNDHALNKLHLEDGRYVSGDHRDGALLENCSWNFTGLR